LSVTCARNDSLARHGGAVPHSVPKKTSAKPTKGKTLVSSRGRIAAQRPKPRPPLAASPRGAGDSFRMPHGPDHERAYTFPFPSIRPRRRRPERAASAPAAPARPFWCPRRRRAPLLARAASAVTTREPKRRGASCPPEARRARDAVSRSTGSALGRPRSLGGRLQLRRSLLRRLRPPPVCRYRCGSRVCGPPHWQAGCACFACRISFSGDG
jgi:hypothetical protein